MQKIFAGIVDYAGLFPPASLGMTEAVRAYAAHRASSERWMLGRFVVSAARLAECDQIMRREGIRPDGDGPWPMSVVLAAAWRDSVALLAPWCPARDGAGLWIDAIELRAATAAEILDAAAELPPEATHYVELPPTGPFDTLVATLASIGASAKLRTGGTTPDLFPEPDAVIAFIQACLAHRVPFKFTAGLHHPWPGRYPLTYEPGADTHPMYGFVPLLLATAELAGGGDTVVARRLIETAGVTIHTDTDGFRWEDRHWDAAALVAARSAFIGFGSCSFHEPVDELGVRT